MLEIRKGWFNFPHVTKLISPRRIATKTPKQHRIFVLLCQEVASSTSGAGVDEPTEGHLFARLDHAPSLYQRTGRLKRRRSRLYFG